MPKLTWLEITGFRSFSITQRLDFDRELALIWGGNSQGKTSIAEAIEFLFTGETVRSVLLGGDMAEHYEALRCAHHPKDQQVAVAAGVVGLDGVERLVRRTLDQDLGRGQPRQTTLTIDGRPASDLSALGIELAEPPLRAPVLLQHSVRYALCARPSDRLAYFKALFELADLDELTAAVRTALGQFQTTSSSIENDLDACLTDSTLGPELQALRDPLASAGLLESSLLAATEHAFAAVGHRGHDALGLAERASLLGDLLDAADQRRFDFAAWRPAREQPSLGTLELERLATYTNVAEKVDVETARLVHLFEAVLALPELSRGHDSDCPVCGSAAALTLDRVEQLRRRLMDTADFRVAQRAARAELAERLGTLRTVLQRVRACVPQIAQADEAAARQASRALGEITGRDVNVDAAVQGARGLRDTASAAETSINDAIRVVGAIDLSVEQGERPNLATATQALGAAARAVDAVRGQRATFLDHASKVLLPAREIIETQSGTATSRTLIRLIEGREDLVTAKRRQEATRRVRREFDDALRDLERAKLQVLNAKFEAMSLEIKRWWDLLRPDEPVAFHRAVPRGQGLRAMSLEAALSIEGDEPIVRDALGLLSDSQLNALGLSAFLARAHLQGSPLVVLDDPVQSGDEAHRDTFIDYVLPELLDGGFQVILTTFEHGFRTLVTKALDPVSFQVDLDDPRRGSVVVAGSHSAKALLNDAKNFIADGQSLRALGAGRLRVAAEAVAKEILVARRTNNGERCSLADYSKWTLEKLVPELQPHISDERARARWSNVSQRLSPGAHDDAPPEKQTLKVVYDQLLQDLRTYGIT